MPLLSAFREQAHQQSAAVANSPHETDDQAFVDSISIIDNDPTAWAH